MSQRERTLAIAVGALVVLIGGFWVFRKVEAGFSLREQTLNRLRSEKSQRERLITSGKLAEQRLERYLERSLPPDPALTERLYLDWLVKSVNDLGFTEPKVNPISGGLRSKTDAFQAKAFTVSGVGSLEQLTRFLHQFYSVDYLHRIKALAVTPRDSKILGFNMTVEALSLADAPERDALHLPPSQRLASGDVEAYLDAICGRNMFGPPNMPPRLTVAGQPAQTNRAVTIAPSASDPDQGDRLTYSWESEDIDGAQFDAQTGRLTWIPTQPGEYEVTITVHDDGVPSRTSESQVKISVTDPPQPVAAPVAENKPPYDQVQFTYLTGFIESNGEPMVWMIDRRTNKHYWLREGEKFQVGTFEGQVKQIGNMEVEFEWYNRQAVVTLGDNLAEDKERTNGELINLRDEPNAS
jgi:hypothetical protein